MYTPYTPDEIDRKVLGSISFGESNAKTAQQIGAAIRIDSRKVRDRISNLRNAGYLIGSTSEGFYYPENREEARHCSQQLWSRVKKQAQVARSFDRSANEKFSLGIDKAEQISLIFEDEVGEAS